MSSEQILKFISLIELIFIKQLSTLAIGPLQTITHQSATALRRANADEASWQVLEDCLHYKDYCTWKITKKK